ncbi:MAG: hypothetical protein ACKVVP_15965 [Chloroflexota bacterium]
MAMIQMQSEFGGVRRGAVVRASDGEAGTVDSFVSGIGGGAETIMVRHGYADYLLAVPVSMIAEVRGGLLRLSVPFQTFQELIFSPTGHFEPTIPSPPVESVIGCISAEFPDGPSTS